MFWNFSSLEKTFLQLWPFWGVSGQFKQMKVAEFGGLLEEKGWWNALQIVQRQIDLGERLGW